MSLNFDTKNQTFRQIMGNGLKYWVPKFQRDYAWSEEQWEDLWQDLVSTEESEQHYLGYLVLQNDDARTFAVIDGQQRLTTISIIILAALYQLKALIEADEEPENNKTRLETLKNTFIGFTDPVSLATTPKLTLNRNNEAFYRRYLAKLESPSSRNLNRSSKLLVKALEFFAEQLKKNELKTGEELAKFIESNIDKMLFTTITVGSDLNAYRVFETLNARGVQLSVPDLVKNYIFSIIDTGADLHDNEILELEETWGEITGQLGSHDFTRFIHAEWNSRNPLAPKNSLFKRIKQNISDRNSAHDYLRKLESAAQTYAALQSENDEFWNRTGYSGARKYVEVLNLFNIALPTGVLLAAYDAFSPERFVKILRYIATVSIRYNIIGSRPGNEQERFYNRLAQKISSGEITNLSGIKNAIREIYVSDDEFRHDFKSKQFRTAQSPKKPRYILARLENRANPELQLSPSSLTLEHIAPLNPSEEWVTAFSPDPVEDSVTLLGNMTLLPADANRDLKNASFSDKKKVYATSSLIITKRICNVDEWNRETIEARQAWLSDLAVNEWHIDFT